MQVVRHMVKDGTYKPAIQVNRDYRDSMFFRYNSPPVSLNFFFGISFVVGCFDTYLCGVCIQIPSRTRAEGLAAEKDSGWRRLIGYLQSQVIFHKRATNYRVFLWKMTYKDTASYGSSAPCVMSCIHIFVESVVHTYNKRVYGITSCIHTLCM